MVPGVLLLLMMLQVERMVPRMAERILMMWKQLRKTSSGHGRRQLRVIGSVGSAPPINEQSILAQLTHSALKGDDVPGIELLFLTKRLQPFLNFDAYETLFLSQFSEVFVLNRLKISVIIPIIRQ